MKNKCTNELYNLWGWKSIENWKTKSLKTNFIHTQTKEREILWFEISFVLMFYYLCLVISSARLFSKMLFKPKHERNFSFKFGEAFSSAQVEIICRI